MLSLWTTIPTTAVFLTVISATCLPSTASVSYEISKLCICTRTLKVQSSCESVLGVLNNKSFRNSVNLRFFLLTREEEIIAWTEGLTEVEINKQALNPFQTIQCVILFHTVFPIDTQGYTWQYWTPQNKLITNLIALVLALALIALALAKGMRMEAEPPPCWD